MPKAPVKYARIAAIFDIVVQMLYISHAFVFYLLFNSETKAQNFWAWTWALWMCLWVSVFFMMGTFYLIIDGINKLTAGEMKIAYVLDGDSTDPLTTPAEQPTDPERNT